MPKSRIPRARSGCLTCRRRKKRCDEIKPVCSDCSRLCLECDWVSEKAHSEKTGEQPAAVSSEAATACLRVTYIPQFLPRLTSSLDRALFGHYLTIVSALLCRRSPASPNPYTYYVVPMAVQNDEVMRCILALSGMHRAKVQPEMGRRSLEHQSQATQILASHGWSSPNTALVGSLLLCMIALFNGIGNGWQHHLEVVRTLLTSLCCQHPKVWTDARLSYYGFVFRLFRLLDSVAAVSLCQPPLLDVEGRKTPAAGRTTIPSDEVELAVYGIPEELFHLVDEVSSLDMEKQQLGSVSELTREKADRIEERIIHLSWQAVEERLPRDAIHVALAFKHALRLRLCQISADRTVAKAKALRTLDDLVGAIQNVRYGSPLELCLLFPILMAGMCCWNPEHRQIIRDRLVFMERFCGFSYISNARDLVERSWEARGPTETTDAITALSYFRFENMHGLVVY